MLGDALLTRRQAPHRRGIGTSQQLAAKRHFRGLEEFEVPILEPGQPGELDRGSAPGFDRGNNRLGSTPLAEAVVDATGGKVLERPIWFCRAAEPGPSGAGPTNR
jgi:hypothetical protein